MISTKVALTINIIVLHHYEWIRHIPKLKTEAIMLDIQINKAVAFNLKTHLLMA